MKGWAPALALKKRPKVIQKWPINGPHASRSGLKLKLKNLMAENQLVRGKYVEFMKKYIKVLGFFFFFSPCW